MNKQFPDEVTTTQPEVAAAAFEHGLVQELLDVLGEVVYRREITELSGAWLAALLNSPRA